MFQVILQAEFNWIDGQQRKGKTDFVGMMNEWIVV